MDFMKITFTFEIARRPKVAIRLDYGFEHVKKLLIMVYSVLIPTALPIPFLMSMKCWKRTNKPYILFT